MAESHESQMIDGMLYTYITLLISIHEPKKLDVQNCFLLVFHLLLLYYISFVVVGIVSWFAVGTSSDSFSSHLSLSLPVCDQTNH